MISVRCLLFFITDSGVGAGIDSYYEYLMKAYILLGDKVYLERFNTVRVLYSLEIKNQECPVKLDYTTQH